MRTRDHSDSVDGLVFNKLEIPLNFYHETTEPLCEEDNNIDVSGNSVNDGMSRDDLDDIAGDKTIHETSEDEIIRQHLSDRPLANPAFYNTSFALLIPEQQEAEKKIQQTEAIKLAEKVVRDAQDQADKIIAAALKNVEDAKRRLQKVKDLFRFNVSNGNTNNFPDSITAAVAVLKSKELHVTKDNFKNAVKEIPATNMHIAIDPADYEVAQFFLNTVHHVTKPIKNIIAIGCVFSDSDVLLADSSHYFVLPTANAFRKFRPSIRYHRDDKKAEMLSCSVARKEHKQKWVPVETGSSQFRIDGDVLKMDLIVHREPDAVNTTIYVKKDCNVDVVVKPMYPFENVKLTYLNSPQIDFIHLDRVRDTYLDEITELYLQTQKERTVFHSAANTIDKCVFLILIFEMVNQYESIFDDKISQAESADRIVKLFENVLKASSSLFGSREQFKQVIEHFQQHPGSVIFNANILHENVLRKLAEKPAIEVAKPNYSPTLMARSLQHSPTLNGDRTIQRKEVTCTI